MEENLDAAIVLVGMVIICLLVSIVQKRRQR